MPWHRERRAAGAPVCGLQVSLPRRPAAHTLLQRPTCPEVSTADSRQGLSGSPGACTPAISSEARPLPPPPPPHGGEGILAGMRETRITEGP